MSLYVLTFDDWDLGKKGCVGEGISEKLADNGKI